VHDAGLLRAGRMHHARRGNAMAGTISVEDRDDAVVVHLLGEHDVSTIPAISDAVSAAMDRSPRVLIDLSDATFLDSSVLGLVLRSGDHCVVIAGEGSLAARRIALLGVGHLLRVATSFEEAVLRFFGSEPVGSER
jgi:anti-anti-sigma factor